MSSAEPGGDPTRDRVREVYRDDRERDDLKTVEDALSAPGRDIDLGFSDRALFALDDTNILQPDQKSNPRLPTGCDGHGTAVASVAAAKAGNKEGVAGVAYDVPLIGLRAGEYWDRPGRNKQAKDDRIEDARATSVNWWELAGSVHGRERHPPVGDCQGAAGSGSEHELRPKSVQGRRWRRRAAGRESTRPDRGMASDAGHWKGRGVAGAGNKAGHWARGARCTPGTGEHAPQAPCGINLIRVEGAVVPDPEGKKFEKFSAVAFPGPSRDADWGDVNLLCVAASWQYGSRASPVQWQGRCVWAVEYRRTRYRSRCWPDRWSATARPRRSTRSRTAPRMRRRWWPGLPHCCAKRHQARPSERSSARCAAGRVRESLARRRSRAGRLARRRLRAS